MARSLMRSMPWNDAAGHFSVLKAVVFVGVFLPAAWMGNEFFSGRWDYPSPYVPLIYHSGLWSTYLLLITLAVTPLRRITGLGRLAQVRRMLGVSSFAYAVLHVLAWFGLRVWDWSALLAETLARPTLWFATVSLLVLLALTLTSVDAAIRAMGALRWKQLHGLGYAAAGLAVLHFLMSPGSMQGAPFLMLGAYAWLMGWRVLERRRLGSSPAALLVLGLGATALTLLAQPLWIMTFQAERAYQTPLAAILDNFNPDIWAYLGAPPVFLMLAFTAATTGIAIIRRTGSTPQAA